MVAGGDEEALRSGGLYSLAAMVDTGRAEGEERASVIGDERARRAERRPCGRFAELITEC